MKKSLFIVGLLILSTFSGVYAGDDGTCEAKNTSAKDSKEMRKLEKKRKKEQRKLERERKKQERLAKKEMKSGDKKEEQKLEKQHKKVKKDIKREQRKRSKEDKKKEKKVKDKSKKKCKSEKKVRAPKKEKKTKEERDLEKQAKKEQKKKARVDRREERKLDKVHKSEKKKTNKIEKENKEKNRKEKSRLKKQQRKESAHMALLNEQKSREAKLAKIEAEKEQSLKLAQNWHTVRASSVDTDYKNGKYADLYILPAWPVSNWFYKDKALINATVFYHYATDAYDSDGASRDITALAFGEKPIYVHDVVLASKLLEASKINFRSPNWISPINQLLKFWGNQEIKLNGRTEEYGLSLDFMRHVLRDDISVGIQVPMKFMRNRLNLDMDFPTSYTSYNNSAMQNMGEFTTHDYQEALRRILRAKGIDSVGGSASGLGDITLFGNVEITTKWVEKIVGGFKFVLPTGRKAETNRLWSPEMGNGGCTEFAAFISLLLKYKPFLNPHLFLQAGFNMPTHVNRRVPAWVESGQNVSSGTPLEYDLMSLADRFQYQGSSFAEWDSSVRGFGDKSISVKFEKGPEITARLGNVFEKFLFRRGFMDIFYNLRVKFEDSYRQVNRDEYQIDILEDNTKQVEHRIGFEYNHQFDSRTRMKAGMQYTFAGINVPKSFDIGVSFAHSF